MNFRSSLLLSIFLIMLSSAKAINPFYADSSYIKIYNGDRYVPFPVKGINFGVATPGKFPGELAVSRNEYGRWLKKIQEAGFNTIRLYTLHFPWFYEVLDSFNNVNKNSPVFILQGVWLEEQAPGYNDDLFVLDQLFKTEIEENVDCVHGNRTISNRIGKAYGQYTRDVSKWLIGYVIGREVIPHEVLFTNSQHNNLNSFQGNYFSISNVAATEAWVTSKLDHLLEYETNGYQIQHPVSFSSWPTLDPLRHPGEANSSEDTASIDLSRISCSPLSAGYFASYHAYPYYPDFISKQPNYQSCTDYIGQNSYICYLQDLKNYYGNIPLLIAETGCPSSWGIAHYAQNGIHHGGFDENEQGYNNIRLAKNISDLGLAGSVMFNWMDEWFKRTWITDPFDGDPDRRILWHNITAAEQNFGLLGFRHNNSNFSSILNASANSPITQISAKADYAFFSLKLNMASPDVLDTILIALDTYDASLGESILPTGQTVANRAEFFLMITNYQAELYVTEAYDTYGYWHGVSDPMQLLHSIPTNGAPWRLVRWRNNDAAAETQYIGNMRVNRLGLQTSSLDAVRIYPNYVEINLPWTLLNFTDPSSLSVLHEDNFYPGIQSTTTNGILPTVFYKNRTYTPQNRFRWAPWNLVSFAAEYLKGSYNIVKEELYQLPGGPVANSDVYAVNNTSIFTVPASNGLLVNDIVMAGFSGEAVVDEAPLHGMFFLSRNGGFTYLPEAGFNGVDSLTYRTISGPHVSEPTKVIFTVSGNGGWANIYPNPSSGPVSISAATFITNVEIYNSAGIKLLNEKVNTKDFILPVQLQPGIYFAKLQSGEEVLNKKFVISN